MEAKSARVATSRLSSKKLWTGIVIVALFVVIDVLRVGAIGTILSRVEGIYYDFRLQATLSQTESDSNEHIVIVDIDERSMEEQGRYPWSRDKVAQLVDKLSNYGAIVIVFDVFFPEPELNPVDDLVESGQISQAIQKQLEEIKVHVDSDRIFAESLTQNDTVLGMLFTDLPEISKGGELKTGLSWSPEEHQSHQIIGYSGVISNIDTLQNAAIGLGFINSSADADGFIRRAALVLEHKGQLYPSIALEAARLYTLSEQVSLQFKKDLQTNESFLESIELVDRKIPTDEFGRILIPYKGPAKTYPYISATDVLMDRVEPGTLEGAVVFIGTSAVGLADLRATSVGLQYPGVEVHANVFEGLLNPQIVPAEPEWSGVFTKLQMAIVGLLFVILMYQRQAITIGLTGISVLIAMFALNLYFWVELKISLDFFLPSLLVLVLTVYYVFVGFVTETTAKKNIHQMFGQYVPPAHIDKLMVSPQSIGLTSERREMTVLFADIRSFTSLSERLSPQELSDFLNAYLSRVTEIIFKHGGTIDKYVGDMVMAFWNAPLDQEEHAKLGVVTALEMIESLQQINKEFGAKGWPEVKLGIGLSTGEMNVGDMGSQYRKAYTVLGDSVNLGSRIESLTKFYGVDVLVSEQTAQQCDDIPFRVIDKVTVVGKSEPVSIYEPVNLKMTEQLKVFMADHNAAFEAYCQKDWRKAREIMLKLKQQAYLSPRIYEILLERMDRMDVNQLPDKWSGEFIHTKK